MSSLNIILNNIGVDKVLHALVCFIISENVGLVFHLIGRPCLDDCLAGLCASVLVGVVKEAYDYLTGKGTCELKDFVADCVGAVLGTLAVLIYSLIIAS